MASMSSFTREIQLFDQHATPPKKFDLTLNQHLHNYVVREPEIDNSFKTISLHNAQILALQTDLKDTKDTLVALGILGPDTPTAVPDQPDSKIIPLNLLYDPLGKTFEISWVGRKYILGISIKITGVTTFVPNPHVALSYTVRIPYTYDPYTATPVQFEVSIIFINILGQSKAQRLFVNRFLKPLAIANITRAKQRELLVVTIDNYDPTLLIDTIEFHSFKDDPLVTTLVGSIPYFEFKDPSSGHGSASPTQPFIDDSVKKLIIVGVYPNGNVTEKGVGYPIPSINPPPPIY
jgi:hypothetical protein